MRRAQTLIWILSRIAAAAPDRAKVVLLVLALSLAPGQAAAGDGEPPPHYEAAGEQALSYARSAVAIGPRPAGSPAQLRQQKWISEVLSAFDCEIERVDFTAITPLGPRRMKNIICKFAAHGDRISVVSGHYDTYYRDGLDFVGANDGASSTAFLLALGGLLNQRSLKDPVWLAFFDGEESTVAWQGDDHTYGSRHQAKQWASSGVAARIRALINVDMIGDSDLDVSREAASTPWLRELVFSAADRLGYSTHFRSDLDSIDDDHIPFLERGVAAVDLIDFRYGFFNRHWHSESDTIDKISARSLAVMLHVVDQSLIDLEARR